ncbi:MAG TPA: hypothetical protein VI341_01545 [Actinomycetota bacterium]
MADDDDILERYERELQDEGSLQAYERELRAEGAPKRSNRGFWLVVGALAISSVVLVVEIFANRPIANTIGHAQFDLRAAQSAANETRASTGSFVGANAAGLNLAGLHDGRLSAVGPDDESSGLDEISVYADATTWAAAVSAEPGACFFLRLDAGRDEPLYGVGTECTAREALASQGTRW